MGKELGWECLLTLRHKTSRVFEGTGEEEGPSRGEGGGGFSVRLGRIPAPSVWLILSSLHFCGGWKDLSDVSALVVWQKETVWIPAWQHMQLHYLWLFQNCQCRVHPQLHWFVVWPQGKWGHYPLYSNTYILKEDIKSPFRFFPSRQKYIVSSSFP